MKIENPNYVAPIEAKVTEIGPKIAQYMLDNPGKQFVTLQDLKVALPLHEKDLTAGLLDMVLQRNKWKKSIE